MSRSTYKNIFEGYIDNTTPPAFLSIIKKAQDAANAMTDKKPMQTEAQKSAMKKAQDELTAAKSALVKATDAVREADKKLKQLS